ncbi:hypothetical protein [Streptomyces sp. NPDC004270]
MNKIDSSPHGHIGAFDQFGGLDDKAVVSDYSIRSGQSRPMSADIAPVDR